MSIWSSRGSVATPTRDSCRSCDAPVLFVRNVKSDATLIVDAEPLEEPVKLEPRLVAVVGESAQILTKANISEDGVLLSGREGGPHPDLRWHRDHHATCPNAEEWRGRTRR